METFYFTGFSGTGKSMIGRMLASRKELEYLDTDKKIEEKENNTINNIFCEKGEDYFRSIENYVLHNNVKQGMIVSLGGGIVKYIENIHFIKKTGRVIYLRAKSSTIYKNLSSDYLNRPLLKDNFSLFTIDKLLNERIPYYEELANFTIDVDNRNLDDIFRDVLAIYNMSNKVKTHIYIK